MSFNANPKVWTGTPPHGTSRKHPAVKLAAARKRLVEIPESSLKLRSALLAKIRSLEKEIVEHYGPKALVTAPPEATSAPLETLEKKEAQPAGAEQYRLADAVATQSTPAAQNNRSFEGASSSNEQCEATKVRVNRFDPLIRLEQYRKELRNLQPQETDRIAALEASIEAVRNQMREAAGMQPIPSKQAYDLSNPPAETTRPTDAQSASPAAPHRKAPGKPSRVELDELKKRLASERIPIRRAMLTTLIQNLENRIRAGYGTEELAPEDITPVAEKVLKEAKDERANGVRASVDVQPRVRDAGGTKPFSKPPVMGMPDDGRAAARGGAGKLAGDGIDREQGQIIAGEVVLTVLMGIFLLVASSGKHPFSFFIVLRLLVTVGAAFWAMRVYQAGPKGFVWPFAAVALLMNPILPVRMERRDWQPIDYWLGVLILVWSGYWAFRALRSLWVNRAYRTEWEESREQATWPPDFGKRLDNNGWPQESNRVREASGALQEVSERAEKSIILCQHLSSKFKMHFLALTLCLLVAVLLFKRALTPKSYDSSAPGILNSQHTVVTRTRNGVTTGQSYEVSYSFVANGVQYEGSDSLPMEPVTRYETIHYMANDPGNNGLGLSRAGDREAVAGLGGGAFAIAFFVFYLLLPKDESTHSRSALAGYGDSAGEDRRIGWGYDASLYVHLSFFLELIVIGTLLAGGIQLIGANPTGYLALSFATVGSTLLSVWIYFDRWSCIEAVAGQTCSGWVNLSMLYVPVIAFLYANFRGMMKLVGR